MKRIKIKLHTRSGMREAVVDASRVFGNWAAHFTADLGAPDGDWRVTYLPFGWRIPQWMLDGTETNAIDVASHLHSAGVGLTYEDMARCDGDMRFIVEAIAAENMGAL